MIRVGVLLSSAKARKLKLEEAVKSCQRADLVEFFVVDPFKSLKEQKLDNVDIIIHRLHDHIVTLKGVDCVEYVAKFREEVDKFKIKLLCSIEEIDTLADRCKIMGLFSSISGFACGNYKVYLPESFDITEELITKGVFEDKLRMFPLIVKSTGRSFVTSERYTMKIYFELSDDDKKGLLEDLTRVRLAAQQFIDHNGILYKMFIMGDKWHVVKRKSIKNLSDRAENSTICFLSNLISKADSVSPLHDLTSSNVSTLIDDNTCSELYNKVMKCFNCQLMGVDFIVEAGTRNIFIIDVNYFPGYDGFAEKHNLGDAIIDLFLKVVKGKE